MRFSDTPPVTQASFSGFPAPPRVDPGFGHIGGVGVAPSVQPVASPFVGPPAAAPSMPSNYASPIHNRASYTGEGDNPNGDWAHVQQIVRQLWPQYGGHFGAGAAPPPIAFDNPLTDGNFAEAYPVGAGFFNSPLAGSISLSPGAVNAIAHPNDPNHDYGLGVIPHETAHIFQSPATFAAGLQEGGADAFARQVGQSAVNQAGLANRGTVGRGAPGYDADVGRAQQQGAGWVTAGQFMTPQQRTATKLIGRIFGQHNYDPQQPNLRPHPLTAAVIHLLGTP